MESNIINQQFKGYTYKSLSSIVSIPGNIWGGVKACQVRDPDGHALLLIEK